MIIDRCGNVSFKRGEDFYRSKKVTIEHYEPDYCEGVVKGMEAFHVTVKTEKDGKLQTTCTCPKLASFSKDCQHIAAVLIAISERQKQGTDGIQQHLTEGLRTLFTNRPIRSSGVQRHFEDREVLEVAFTLKTMTMGPKRTMFGIELNVGSIQIGQIRDFLKHVKEGLSYRLSDSLLYDQRYHCFEREVDAVFQRLIHIVYDEKLYVDHVPENFNKEMLLIPPSIWDRLLPLLMVTPFLKLEYDGQTSIGLQVARSNLPLTFDFSEADGEDYQLMVNGLPHVTVLTPYQTVLYKDKLFRVGAEESVRLAELKQMLEASGTEHIPIPKEQIGFFLEKAAPALKSLGEVNISKTITERLMRTPLIAKLYLDRVKNRLLAGLEFHYDHYVIHPLEDRELPLGSLVVRDVEREEEILQLMDDSAFTKTDGGYFMHNEELEYEFLMEKLPKLQKKVQVYATTAVRNRVTRGGFRPRIRVKVKKDRINWLAFKFEMEGIPEQQIRDILAALEEKRKYYRLPNGSLLSLEAKEYEEIRRFLYSPYIESKALADGLDLTVEQSLQLLDTVEVGDIFTLEKSFREFMDTLRHPGRLEFEVPTQLKSTLREYQNQGFQWMKTLAHYGFGGILADDMGLGKTLQAITFILSELKTIRNSKRAALIVCPSSLTYNWFSEIKKFVPEIKTQIIDGHKKERANTQQTLQNVDVMITSYPLLRADIKWYEQQAFHTAFFDEAQAFKNPITQTARAVKKIKADNRFALTGTPVENASEELWSIFHVVFPELFLGLKEYSQLTTKAIARRIRPFLLRRVKEEVLSELPEKMVAVESVELLPDQKRIYSAYLAKLREQTLKHLDKETIRKNRIKILAGLTRLRQICCHPGLFVEGYEGSSAKFEQLLEILEEARQSGKRVLIFSQFTKMLALIGRALVAKGHTYFYLDGQTPSEQRLNICDRFNAGERDLFLISLKAGGTGLNLTSADTVILYDTWWNPAVEAQAADRAHRIGQKKVVNVIKLIARGTIEEKMNELQEQKRHLIKEIIDSGDNASVVLSEEELREILMI